MFPSNFLYEFLALLIILDPIATVPIFLSVSRGLSWKDAMKVGMAALGVAFCILTVFIFIGLEFLEALNIPTASFQLAGSFILFTLGLSMVTGKLNDEMSKLPANASILDRAIYPLAMPSIAGAGAILTVVMLTDNHARTISEQLLTTYVLALCLLVHLVSFSLSAFIMRYVGLAGVHIVTRIFGLMICSIAVSGMVIAIKIIFTLN
jgi:multiple antibiotic resistance protein